MSIQHSKIEVTTAGEDGSAEGATTSTFFVRGYPLAYYINYVDEPGTTDVTIATAGTTHPALTLLTLTSANTDAWKFPRLQLHDSAGVALTLDGTRTNVGVVPIADAITVTVAQGDDEGSVVVWVLWDDGK